MRRIMAGLIFLGFCIFPLSLCGPREISLQQELTIGADDGDDNYLFGRISSIDIDADNNLYVLDYKMWRIQKYDESGAFLRSFAVRKGQGPAELTFPGELSVDREGGMALYDFMAWKILILDSNGLYQNSFNLDFNGIGIRRYEDGSILVMGAKDDRLFHVFTAQGKKVRSFGRHFPVPNKLKQVNFPTVMYPQIFTIGSSDRILVCHPHKYEISSYINESLSGKVEGSNPAFLPVSVENRSVTFTDVAVYEYRDWLFSSIASHGEMPNQLDIFKQNRQVASLDVSGFIRAVDSSGRLYIVESDPFPRVSRYRVQGLF